jgi:hypothetical protein
MQIPAESDQLRFPGGHELGEFLLQVKLHHAVPPQTLDLRQLTRLLAVRPAANFPHRAG